jgi:hypothetical protein
MFKIAIVGLLVLCPTLWAKPSLTGSGYIPRSLSDNQLFLEITVKGLEAEKADLAADLDIYIKEHDPNVAISYVSDQNAGASVFMFSTNQAQEVIRETNNTFTTKMFLRVDGQSGVLEDLMESRSSLSIQVDYTGADNISFTIQRDTAVANEAPVVDSFRGGHLKVTARIQAKELIAFTTGNKAGSAVKLYLAKKNSGIIAIPMLVYNPNAATDTEEATCEFDTSAADGTDCLSCSATQSYIRNSEVGGAGVFQATGKFGSGSVSITGLEDETEYIGFLAYEPNGLLRSLCFSAAPAANQSWSEMMDEDMDVKVGDPNCFVATAVGSTARELDILRKWRDTSLLNNRVGQMMVWTYYQVGPYLAAFIADKEWLKKPIHKIISTFSSWLETTTL